MEIREISFVRRIFYTLKNYEARHSFNHGRCNKIFNKGTRVETRFQFLGNNNVIQIMNKTLLKNSLFHISGNNNRIIVHDEATISGAEIWIEDDNCLIEIGSRTYVGHHSHLACTENGSQLSIGDDCMLSSYVQVRTGDSHSILDIEGNRINLAESVHIGNHCWIGEGVKVLKGVNLNSNTVVGTGAIVTKSFKGNVLIGGVPANIIKEKINWNSKRI